MRSIALVSQKGGVGKTILASNLAVVAAQAGERVIAIDLDEQASLAEWATRRTETGVDVVRRERQGAPIAVILAALGAKGYSLAILDCPGKFDTANVEAMKAVDLCLVPSRPAILDLQATRKTVSALLAMGRNFAFILNQCPPQPNNSRARAAASALSIMGAMADPAIAQRAAYQDAVTRGRGVTEDEPDGKAADEIRRLWAWAARNLIQQRAA